METYLIFGFFCFIGGFGFGVLFANLLDAAVWLREKNRRERAERRAERLKDKVDELRSDIATATTESLKRFEALTKGTD